MVRMVVVRANVILEAAAGRARGPQDTEKSSIEHHSAAPRSPSFCIAKLEDDVYYLNFSLAIVTQASNSASGTTSTAIGIKP